MIASRASVKRWVSALAVGVALARAGTASAGGEERALVLLKGGSEPTRFELYDPATAATIASCHRWCSVELAPGTYRLRVWGGRPGTERVSWVPVRHDLVIRAHVPDERQLRRGRRMRNIGLVAMVGGAVVAVAGVVSEGLSGLSGLGAHCSDCDWVHEDCDCSAPESNGNEVAMVAGAIGALGLVATIGGAATVRAHRTTTMRIRPLRPSGERARTGVALRPGPVGLAATWSF